MSTIGHTINGGLVVVVVVAVVGMTGTTLFFHHSVDRLDERADTLSDKTNTLEQNLTATHAELRAERERSRELDERLAVAKSDVSTLSYRFKQNQALDATVDAEAGREQADRTPAEDDRTYASAAADVSAANDRGDAGAAAEGDAELEQYEACDSGEMAAIDDATTASSDGSWDEDSIDRLIDGQRAQERQWDYELQEEEQKGSGDADSKAPTAVCQL